MKYFDHKIIFVFFLCLILQFIWSGQGAKRIDLWFAETLPILMGLLVLIKTFKVFPLTLFSYSIVFIAFSLMLIGAYYSYSQVPLFDSFKEILGFERNHYDKLIHFFQGLAVTVLAREVLTRKIAAMSFNGVNFFSFMCAAAIAAIWEIVEWLFVILVSLQGVIEPVSGYLGEQGYAWDAQSDMFFALIGSLVMIWFFSKYHDVKIKKLLLA